MENRVKTTLRPSGSGVERCCRACDEVPWKEGKMGGGSQELENFDFEFIVNRLSS